MSRHRFIRELDIEAERDDGALSDGADEMTPEEHAQLEDGLERVRATLGDERNSLLLDDEIRNELWDAYFDVDKAVGRLIDIQEQRRIAQERKAAREREKKERAEKLAAQKKSAETATRTPKTTPKKKSSGTNTPTRKLTDPVQLDVAGMNLGQKEELLKEEPLPKMSIAREKVIEEAKVEIESDKQGRKAVSLIVIGHVDAGKSTLTGRLLYALDRVSDKEIAANERASERIGKSSFSWAWQMDGTTEERERGITMDIAQQTLLLPHRVITILDAPGHRDFIPNMISGAAQADSALLVVDASPGEFEAGFARGGQTREHIVLVRSLGVTQVVVAVNKLDVVNYDQVRYEEVCEQLRAFLSASGFAASKMRFVPVAAMAGVGLGDKSDRRKEFMKWAEGSSLVELLDKLQPPTRDIEAPLRIPIANIFKGTGSSTGVTGRVLSGVVQVGEKLRVLPGEESAVVKSIQFDEESRSWAAAGANVTLYLTAIDPVHLSVGFVLCPPVAPVPLATVFSARIIVFDIQVPILAGSSVELFVHSHDVPASISKLVATLDRATGNVTKQNPRVLTKGLSAEVQITVRATSMSGAASRAQAVPLEPFSVNKEMGRVLVRRGGETIAAGIVLSILN